MLAEVTERRLSDPELPRRRAQSRKRPPRPSRVHIIAADHPARGVLRVGEDAVRMGDRADYLARIIRSLQAPHASGVMATMDVLEDLLYLDAIAEEWSSASFLDEKLLIASLNRGGLAGASWELDDPATGISVSDLSELGLDGAKFLLRIALDERDCLPTLVAASEAVSAMGREAFELFMEPLSVHRAGQAWAVDLSADALIRAVSIAQGLGRSTARVWLKLPFCEDFDRVVRATTLPIVLLGGAARGASGGFEAALEAGVSISPSVRGTMVGRNVLYPGTEDPLVVSEVLGRIACRGEAGAEARRYAATLRGQEIGLFQGGGAVR